MIEFMAPKASTLMGKGNGILAAMPTDQKVCYGLNLMAADVPVETGTCSKTLGTYTGFVEEGGVLSLEVSKGTGRTFELYAVLVGLGESCPTWSSAFNANPENLGKLFLIGSAQNKTIQLAEEKIEIVYSFPGVDRSVASEQGATCADSAGLIPKLFGFLSSSGEVVNA